MSEYLMVVSEHLIDMFVKIMISNELFYVFSME